MGGLVLGLLLTAVDSPPPGDKAALKLIKQVPAFARRKLTFLRSQPIDDRPGHYVEVQWKEGKAVRLAVAVILDVAKATPAPPWLAQDGAWGVAEVHEDRTLAGLLAAQQRARNAAREQGLVRDLRAFVAAQDAYKAANSGFYGEPSCLRAPWDCVPGHEREAPAFLGPDAVVEGERNGYRFSFHRGAEGATTVVPPAPPSRGRSRGSPPSPPPPLEYSGLVAYAVTAVPVGPPSSSARRLCADASGRVCAIPGNEAPVVVEGSCPATCQPIE